MVKRQKTEAAEASCEAAGPEPAVQATPSMAQYLEIKKAHPDSLLWYRMGDFYELFFDDAVTASEALGIVLTKRGKHGGGDIPMCGVPIHRADDYLHKLIRQGHRVAVCEQLEDPSEARKRGHKAVVRRDVVRLVTPGTLTEDSLLDARSRNYLTAVLRVSERGQAAGFALASLDISTGEFETSEVSATDLAGELARLAPGEVIAADTMLADGDLNRAIDAITVATTPVPTASFDAASGERTLKARLGVADLGAFGAFTRAELAAAGALLRYVDLTQMGAAPAIRPPRRAGDGANMIIDAASRAGLELVRTTSGEKRGSLLGAIDCTVTGAGARELEAWLSNPLRDPAAINDRLAAVDTLVEDQLVREAVRAILRGAPDVARAVGRLTLNRGGPRDLGAVRDGLEVARLCASALAPEDGTLPLPESLARITAQLQSASTNVLDRLSEALVDLPPHLKRDGGFVRSGYRTDLDAALRLREDSRAVIAALETRYADQTGVKSLKVRHNNILGYFVEVSQANAKPLQSEPLAAIFRHKQTIASAVRFTTLELAEIEGRVASAGERALAIEQDVFSELAASVLVAGAALGDIGSALADLDVLAALAELADKENYVRPIVDDTTAFEIEAGRHPVVEQALKRAAGPAFIENDCSLGSARANEPAAQIWLVTGPNMAGKSTFLRQNALIAVLAQMGSFVPARRAHVGVIDRLFSRVGAADDLARGRSTFMVEMVETAAILNQATARSLIVLDEVGRGTATFDGLSIAWATVEYLHDVVRARALFATHYHELTALAGRLACVANVTMDVTEWQDEIIFLHRVKAGAANRSYGLQVAKLAGLPKAVTDRAANVLHRLEKNDRRGAKGHASLDGLPLFVAAPVRELSQPSEIEAAVASLDPDAMTPRSALDALYTLKNLALRTSKTKGDG